MKMENNEFMKTEIETKDNSIEMMKKYDEIKSKKNNEIDKRLMDIFLSIGISAHLQGYHYLRESIKLIMEHPDYISSITKLMYPKIADKFSTTPCRVERAIRHALEVSFNKGKMIRLNDVLELQVLSEDERPTNSEFVALIADKLNIETK
ncbi:MAG: sporulation initiation factor Spo0A C-terminal domain-containing protein [Christensenellales bacterium]